jgi:hypothetical protein
VNQNAKALLGVLAVLLAVGGAVVIAKDAAKKPSPDQNKEAVRPFIAEKFGKVITVEGVFVEKRQTYHDQNIVQEPYLLRVLAVDGKDLETPVTIEYLAGNGRVENGVKYRMKAYETVYTMGAPAGWNKEPSQVVYYIYRQLIIKDLSQAP